MRKQRGDILFFTRKVTAIIIEKINKKVNYYPHKDSVTNHLVNLNKIIDRKISSYDKYVCIGYFYSETYKAALRNLCDLCKLKNLVREPTCFKNPRNPWCIDFLLTNCKKFSRYQVIETCLSDFHKTNLTVLKMCFTKQKHESTFYRNYKECDNLNLRKY